MKNKTLIGMLIATTAIIILFLIVNISCSRKDNPLSVDPNNSNTSGTAEMLGPKGIYVEPAYGGQLSPLDQAVYVLFDHYMDESTLTTDNISIVRLTADSEVVVSINLEYYPGTRLLSISPSDLEFEDNSAFVLTLSNDIRDETGTRIDGNGNGVADSSQYDSYRSIFYTGSGSSDLPDFISPTINKNLLYPNSDITQLSMDSSQFRITVGFNGGDIDTTELTTDILRVYHLGKANDVYPETTYVPNLLVIQSRSFSSVTYRLRSQEDSTKLIRGDRYLAEFIASAVSDTFGNPLLWGDEVNDGSIASFYFGFLMEPKAGEDIVPPNVSAVNFDNSIGSWRATVMFSEPMDTTTYNDDNIAFFDGNRKRLDGNFIRNTDYNGFVFYPRLSTVEPIYYYITAAVIDTSGNMLDADGNGRGGEPSDIYTNLPPGP